MKRKPKLVPGGIILSKRNEENIFQKFQIRPDQLQRTKLRLHVEAGRCGTFCTNVNTGGRQVALQQNGCAVVTLRSIYKASKPVQLKCERRKTAKESQAEHDSKQKQDDDVEETTA